MTKGYVGIPTSYTPIEYIESSGTQYIDTGLAQNGYHSVIDTSINNFNSLQIITGTYGPADNQRFYTRINTNGSLVTQFGGYSGNNVITGPTLSANTRYLIDTKLFNGTQTLSVDSTNYGTRTISGQSFPTANIYLFAILGDGGEAANLCSCKLYSAKYYDSNNTLVRDFIPVIDQDNVVCLYEQVEGKFYYNQGIGTFTAGNTIGQPVSTESKARKLIKGYVGVPMSYTPVEYIESTGTQYIDTGFEPDSNTSVILEAKIPTSRSSNITRFFESRNDASSVTGAFGVISFNDSNNLLQMRYDTSTNLSNGQLSVNIKHKISMLKNQLYVDDVLKITAPTATFQTNYSLLIFGFHTPSARQNAEGVFSLYSFKVYDNDTLVRDFIPAIDQDNTACMYDQVEGKLYYNSGTGTFTAGSITGQPVSLGDKARRIIRGYVGVNGVAKLCFGSFIPRYSASITDTVHTITPAVANTTDYIIVAGGQTTNGASPVKTVTAYPSSLVATQAPDMPTQSSYQGACGFNGYAIIASGKSGSSGNYRTNQVLAYSNNLTRSTLATLSTSVFESTATSNNVHCIVQGGTRYDAETSFVTSYDTNFTKTMPTGMSVVRRNHSSAAVGDYIVCCGAFNTRGNVDFYDNTNVRTTVSDPYGKNCNNPLGIGTNNHAIFFGGGTSQNASTAYSDCKAFDQNKVLTSFALPQAVIQAQGFSTGDYAFVAFRFDSYVYDDNLVLVEHATHDGAIYGYSVGTQGAATDSFAVIHQDWATNLRIITM